MRQSKRAVIYFVCFFFFIDDGSNQWHEHKRGWLFECTITYRLLYSDNVDILVTIFCLGGGGVLPWICQFLHVIYFLYMSLTRMGQIGTECFSINWWYSWQWDNRGTFFLGRSYQKQEKTTRKAWWHTYCHLQRMVLHW